MVTMAMGDFGEFFLSLIWGHANLSNKVGFRSLGLLIRSQSRKYWKNLKISKT